MFLRSSGRTGVVSASLLSLLGCGEPSGAFVVAISSEASVPGELDRFEVNVSRGSKAFSRAYSAPGGVKIPGTLTITNDTEGSDEPVTVTVSARKGEGEGWRVVRSARLRFVEEKTKILRLSLRYSCFDHPCSAGQTCSGGQCVGIDVDAAALPEAGDPSEALPGKGQHGCFDPEVCLRDASEVEVSPSCSFPLASGNAAAEWKLAPGKLVVLEPDPVEGYTVQGGVASLARGLCEAFARGDLRRVVTSNNCPGKPRSAAVCSDASDASLQGGAGGQAGVSGAGGAGQAGQGGAGEGGAGQGGAGQAGAGQGGAGQGGAGQGGAGQGGVSGSSGQAGQGGQKPICGDGAKNGDEPCDGEDFGDATCASVTGEPGSAGPLNCFGCQIFSNNCSHCGDNQKGGNEECDGVVSGVSCETLVGKYATGNPTCTSGCKISQDGCEFCGNGKASPEEGCDGDDLGGKTCADVVGAGATGVLSCNQCQFDVSGCSTPVFTSESGGLQPGALWPMAWRHPSGWAHAELVATTAPKTAWTVPFAVTGSPVVAADGTIYFASGKKLVALDVGGQIKWNFDCGSEAGRSPAINKNGDVFLGAAGGTIYWVKPDGQLKTKGTHPSAKFEQYGDMVATPNKAAVLGSIAGSFHLVAIFPTLGGDSSSNFGIGDNLEFTSPAISPDGGIWVGVMGGSASQIVIYEGKTGGVIYDGGPASGPPVFGVNGAWYLNTKSGKLVSATWSLDGVGASKHLSVASDGTLYVAAEGGDLTAVNPEGSIRWVYKPPSKLAGTSVIGGDGTIYAPAGNQIIAVSPEGKEKWIFTNDTPAPFSSDLAIGASGMLLVSEGSRLLSIQ